MKSLDFNTLKKKYFTVTLANEQKTKLMICVPTKKILNRLNDLQNVLTDDIGEDALMEVYDLIAVLMSHNKTGHTVTAKELEEIMDFEDIMIFVTAYTDFVAEIANSKN